MAYWIDVNGSTSKDPVNARNQAAWLQKTGGRPEHDMQQRLDQSLATFLASFEASKYERHYE